jgi:hypothetical protein
MIQIQARGQFTKAAERAGKERMRVRRYEPGVYEVTNKQKGHSYLVHLVRLGANVFGKCTCEAGTPNSNCVP